MHLLLFLAMTADLAERRALDRIVVEARKTWSVPGVAVVVVRDNRVIYCEGHGVRQIGRKDPVTPDTLFALSSCTKTFTSAVLAQLVEQEKLAWDDPVRKHLPWFRLADPLVEEQVTLRDLVCHRTGLGTHELLWHHAPYGPEEAVRRLRYLPLAHPFRTTLHYQSTAFAAAGLAAGAAAGTTWQELVEHRLLQPLKMSKTRLSAADAQRVADRATGHRLRRSGEVELARRLDETWYDPAISIWSSARDLGEWLRYQLGGSTSVRETHRGEIPILLTPSQKSVFPCTNQMSYAKGWAVHDYHGVKFLSHGGSLDGFRAHLTFSPERRLGIAILANLEHTPLPLALSNLLVDELLHFPRRDWHGLFREWEKTRREELEEEDRARLRQRRHGTRPSRELGAYVGKYQHAAYGEVEIGLARGRLIWKWRGEEVALHPFHHDTFALGSEMVQDAQVTFTLDRAGDVVDFVVTGRLEVRFEKFRSKPR